MNQGAYSIHKAIRQELENYIKTQYFGKSPLLFDALKEELSKEGILYKEPYIESLPAYQQLNNISEADIDDFNKRIFIDLAEAGMGVYKTPYIHQIEALENAILGRDIFVSTGTGSGKTECFMWPLVSKLMCEAKKSNTWNMRGIRAMIMYPMNALVSDQLSRLRNLIGDSDHKFLNIFRNHTGKNARRPQFGMYTGRTPYPGIKNNRIKDSKLASTYERLIKPSDLNVDELEYYSILQKQGRIPAKIDLRNFIENLNAGVHFTNEDDAELITRFEMQNCCPDILITNYSMLEYMLLRPREQKIWDETRSWLASDKDNKLLFIIDEAHMYRGSSGGEVALLIRRLLHKLNIDTNKVQFILTTASMPHKNKEDEDAVKKFAYSLTGKGDFVYIEGKRELTEKKGLTKLNFVTPSLDLLEKIENENTRYDGLIQFWETATGSHITSETISDMQDWMYNHLLDYSSFNILISRCRAGATSLSTLAKEIYPQIESDMGKMAISLLISIAQLACSKDGKILFPAKMHLLFRGLNGVYACVNPKCPKHNSNHKVTVGDIFLNNIDYMCNSCGSMNYELYEDRRCGALFFKGFVSEDDFKRKKAYLWHYKGQDLDKKMMEIHLYIPEDDYVVSGNSKIKPCYMNLKSGFIDFLDDSHDEDPEYRKLYYSDYIPDKASNTYTFSKCPHCKRILSKLRLISFATRGNQSFNNLIKTQFNVQPAVESKQKSKKKYPNEGRKVLLFSDSRQRAAVLARDMTKESDMNAARQLFMCAIADMNKNHSEISLDDIYGYFLGQAIKHNTHIFGEKFREEHERIEKINNASQSTRRRRTNSKPEDFRINYKVSSKPDDDMMETILRLYCGNYNTLLDDALSWIEPVEQVKNNIFIDIADDIGIPIGAEEEENKLKYKIDDVFNAWFMDICDSNLAIGHVIPNRLRDRVRRNYKEPFGLTADWNFSKTIIESCNWKNNDVEMKAFREAFGKYLLESANDIEKNYFIGLDKIKPMYDLNHRWYKCPICSAISPRKLMNRCPCCGSDKIEVMTETGYQSLEFWRKPAFDAISGGSVRVLNTEEHTAQLSHKDQQYDMWSKTEEYELRFQDMVRENETPVDILSSTTTMEVGIDIGSLVAVGLRNIPPMRENYQQRAGRAGRRGATLSTIVTFCENGAYDSLYFNDPTDMFSGEPRRPWIDVDSYKLIYRHINMILLQDFVNHEFSKGLDDIATSDFFEEDGTNKLQYYVSKYELSDLENLVRKNLEIIQSNFQEKLITEIKILENKYNIHRELYIDEDKERSKPLLDALYEEGIIPTYSFPKNVVSLYINDYESRPYKLKYQVERGLDVAIGEYAPGRSVVVDKKTYQIGGLYYPGLERINPNSPISSFIEDPNYKKAVLSCHECGWFGINDNTVNKCPFCGNTRLLNDLPMVKPWGFAPRNGKAYPEVQIEEAYSKVQPPLYSTLPSENEMNIIDGFLNIRQAMREEQNIILLNKGPLNTGFKICPDCGAIAPNISESPLNGVSKPFRQNEMRCSHHNAEDINIGYDFKTDMLVLEFWLDPKVIDINIKNNLWLSRAGTSLAESLKLVAGCELDIEFTELVTGYRIRNTDKGAYIDVYMYDSLSSGAGYSKRIAEITKKLLEATIEMLSNCTCGSACYDCLKHYRNQHVHSLLDRFAAKELLEWGAYGKLPQSLDIDEQWKLLKPIEAILKENGIDVKKDVTKITLSNRKKSIEIEVFPSMIINKKQGIIVISDYLLKYAKPTALEYMKRQFDDL